MNSFLIRGNKLGPGTLEFDFFTELCSLLGVSFKGDASDNEWSSNLCQLHALLETLLKYDVYQVIDFFFHLSVVQLICASVNSFIFCSFKDIFLFIIILYSSVHLFVVHSIIHTYIQIY